ncbi:MAG: DUF2089 family protein [Planctomycetota bacterium]
MFKLSGILLAMTRAWLDDLSDEDLAFVKRFVLASGSLKAIAEVYGVSYPTVRTRLNTLIEKVRLADEAQEQSAFERKLRLLAADGRVDPKVIGELLRAHEESSTPDSNGPSNRKGAKR